MLSFDEFKGKYPQFDAFSPKKKGHVNKSHQGRGMEATAAHFQATKKHKSRKTRGFLMQVQVFAQMNYMTTKSKHKSL